jgi:hypothetical protein
MPTGGATGNATGLIGSAPSAAGGVCWSGGADEASEIESLKERVAKLERALQYVLGQDISAGQLSDISQVAGWIYDVEYMGKPGWTKTSIGTLIPPAGLSLSSLGFKMSDGNDYPLVVMDENGVLQYGFTSGGAVKGASSSTQIAMLYTDDPGGFSGNGTIVNIPTQIGYDPDNLVNMVTSSAWQVNQSGYYNMSIACGMSMSASVPSLAVVEWDMSTSNTNPTFTDVNRANGPCLEYSFETGGGFFPVKSSSAKMMYLKSGINHDIEISGTGAGTSFAFDSVTMTLQLIKTG